MSLFVPETSSYGGVGLTSYDPYSASSYDSNYNSTYDTSSASSSWLYSGTGDIGVDSDTSFDTFNEVMDMVGSGADWLESHETIANLGAGAVSGLMNWSSNDILQDQNDQLMQYNYDKMNLSEEQTNRQLDISQQLADASAMNADTNRRQAEWAEDQRQQHNSGISSFGSKYGK